MIVGTTPVNQTFVYSRKSAFSSFLLFTFMARFDSLWVVLSAYYFIHSVTCVNAEEL